MKKTYFDKTCECGEVFIPFRTTDKRCYICTKVKKAMDNLKKEKATKTRAQKESLLTLSDYLKKAQKVFNTFIRNRDLGKNCISCDRVLVGKFDAGHYYNANNHYNVRFDETNVNGQCVHCNRDKHGNLIEYREGVIKRFGVDELDRLDSMARVTRKFTKEELKEIINKYK